MTDDDPAKTRKLSRESKEEALRRILEKRKDIAGEATSNGALRDIPESHYRFEKFAEYQTLELQQMLAKKIDLENPSPPMEPAPKWKGKGKTAPRKEWELTEEQKISEAPWNQEK